MKNTSKSDISMVTTNQVSCDNNKHQRDMKVDNENKKNYQDTLLALIERNQIPLTRTLLGFLYLSHFAFPTLKPYTSKFIFLQYNIEPMANGESLYDIGFDDIYFVINWVIGFTFLRSFLMQWCFGPFASYFCNIHSKKANIRFSEQSWSFVYASFSLIFGAYLYYHSPYFLDFDNIYLDWPHDRLSGLFKTYYLISTAFWIQQVFVLNIEKKRKDHYQMFSHHIITCFLILGSYYYYFMRIGNLILMIMDSVDIFLTSAKMLKYAGFTVLCDIMFILFSLSWFILRHGLYNYLFFHAWSKSTILMENGRCIAGAAQKRCWTPTVINTFLGLLGGLQVIILIWLFMIIKVAYQVISGQGADDVRSDEDDTDFEDLDDGKTSDISDISESSDSTQSMD